jgi:cysteine desulfuration protein SufE
MTIEEIENEIIEEFAIYDDWMDKYEYIIELGKDLSLIKEENKLDDKLIKGCQSRVWLDSEKDGELLNFYADSDAIITKGIISLLLRVYSGQKPEEIAKSDVRFIKEIGLQEHLSPTRANGLLSMVQQIKLLALQNVSK